MPESTQHKLDRIRPPRVQITYDVETRGSFVKMELPFVVGILADLSGNVPTTPTALRDRKYVEIDRDNFNDIMKSIGPKVQLNGGSKTVAFNEIGDFSPIKVLKQLDDVHDHFKKRTSLSDAVAKLDGNVKLQQNLLKALTTESERNDLKAKLVELKALVAPKTEAEPAKSEPGTTEEPKQGPENEGGKS
jgi:type VI secretion system ImpB/VipA family protein